MPCRCPKFHMNDCPSMRPDALQRRRILLLGGDGQVAWELRRALATLGEVIDVSRRAHRHPLDLARPEQIRPVVEAIRPTWIVNAAAYTAVDQAETEETLAMQVNGLAPGLLAEAAARVGALLVHYSTDYVFDGGADRPYTEDDVPNPLSAYGRTKLAGEEAVAAAGGDFIILRTCWVYGARGRNFMRSIRRLAAEREELRVVNDQHGAPTWSRHIAEATAQILVRLDEDRAAWQRLAGTYHLAASGATTWHGFAERIVEHQRQGAAVKCTRVLPIPSAEYPTPARRPVYAVLNTDRLAERFGVRLPDWGEGLVQVQQDLDAAASAVAGAP